MRCGIIGASLAYFIARKKKRFDEGMNKIARMSVISTKTPLFRPHNTVIIGESIEICSYEQESRFGGNIDRGVTGYGYSGGYGNGQRMRVFRIQSAQNTRLFGRARR